MLLADLPVLPACSGVYLFLNAKGKPLYIGKANNLRSRVQQHFKNTGKSAKFSALAHAIQFITTQSELEALLLEANLIKQHRPHYNVLLKDDKDYPFLKLTHEPYPMLTITRRVSNDQARYFGPYPDGYAVRRVKGLLDTLFALRKNSGLPMQKRDRPCLNYHMGRCLAPCVGYTDPQSYAAVVEQVSAVLSGQWSHLTEQLQQDMRTAAQNKDFEQAAKIRDRLQALHKLFGEEQRVLQLDMGDLDFIGFAAAGEFAMVQLFKLRHGRVIGRDMRFLNQAEEATPDEIIGTFIQDYYRHATQVPPLILIPNHLEDAPLWNQYLSERFKRQIEFRHPQRGEKVELLDMAMRNAEQGLESELLMLQKRGQHPGLDALQELLALPERPWRIEGYDNSNLFGSHIVSGMVVFEGGTAKRSGHRRFKVQGLDHPDDYASMRQTLYRRFTGRLADSLPLPDLILIDGGHGQVSAACEALQAANVRIPVVGLAKREELIILPSRFGVHWWLESGQEVGHRQTIALPPHHPALRTLIGVRDEVHQYVIQYHRKLRGEQMLKSVFADLPGIGEKRQHILLERYSNLAEIAATPLEELAQLPGMGLAAAKTIAQFLQQQPSLSIPKPK